MTERQTAFLVAYLADPKHNATKAAASAGYSWPDKQGARLKTMPGIAEVIQEDEDRWWREREARWQAERRRESDRDRWRFQSA